MLGERINIEFARGGRDRRDDYRGRDMEVRYPRPRRTSYRVIVENLSQNVSWQDLKDFMRTAGEVTYADCSRDGSGKGIVEFETEEDLRAAIRKLDGVEFKGSEVVLREDLDVSRPRSRSPRRNRSPRYRTYDRGYDRSYDRGYDRYDRRSPRYRRDDRDNYYRRDDYSSRRAFKDDRYSTAGSYDRTPLRDRSQTRSPVRSSKDFSPREESSRIPAEDSVREREY